MKKILGLIIALGMMVPAFASIGVAPTRIEVNANKIKGNYFATAIDVKGDVNKPMRFKVYPEYFILNENSELVMMGKKTDEFDLSKKVRFVPSEFSVAPGKAQKVRVNIANINSLPEGENRVLLFVEDVEAKQNDVPVGPSGFSAKLIVKTRIGIPVYIDKGKITREADIEYLNIENKNNVLHTTMKINAKGNSRVRYAAHVQIIQGKKLIDEYDLPNAVVAQNGSYVDTNPIDVSKVSNAGDYTLRVTVSYYDGNGKRQTVKKETILSIKGNV